jgi:hypothetical protein
MFVFSDTVEESLGVPANESLASKNTSSVQNRQRHLQVQTFGDVDDLASVWSYGAHNPGNIVLMELLPFLSVVQTMPEVMEHLRCLNRMQIPLTFYYDTTYEIGKAFSILSPCF